MIVALPLLSGCYKLRARIQLKEGNSAYQNEDYREAIDQYEKGLKLDPDATFAWRSVGLAALALYRPGEEKPENTAYAETAIDAFEKYLEDYPDDEKVREYLLSIYINAKKYDDALRYLDQQAAADPAQANDVKRAKITILTQADRLDEAWQLAQAGGADAQAFYTIGVSAWNAAYNDPDLDFEARTKVVDTGIEALERALELKPEDSQSMTYYNLILREKAKLTTDGTERLELEARANEWQQKALAQIKADKAKQEAEAKAAAAQNPAGE